jgi:predicted nucleic acid-binding protein
VRRGREVCSLVAAALPVEEEDVRRAMALMEQHAGLGVRDALHAATALRWECHPVVSADRGFDALERDGLVRADPLAFAGSLPPPAR